MVFLDLLDTHMSSIQVPTPAFRVYRWMVHYFYRYPHSDAYFYLRGCVSGLFLELDFSYHCGTFVVGFLVKNCTVWTTHLAYSEQLVQR